MAWQGMKFLSYGKRKLKFPQLYHSVKKGKISRYQYGAGSSFRLGRFPFQSFDYHGSLAMVLRINDVAPDFAAQTTQGQLSFHDWLGDSWGVLFSHPKDFTPVCTTELGALAGLQDEFAARDVKVIGPSVNPADDHARWLTDIGHVTGHVPAYPMIADTDLAVAKLYDMRHAAEGEAPGCGPPPITPRCGPLVLSR